MPERTLHTQCVIAGGGPAGIMLGFLLARSGVEVAVLEKWPDFFRDFRGDTIHPSTMELLEELGILDQFLALPHDETRQLEADIGDTKVTVADFSHVPTKAKFIAFMPQWDFLNFITAKAKKYPSFKLLMETEATDVIKEGDAIVGVTARAAEGDFEIRADVVVGCDGRHSTIKEKAGLTSVSLGAPMDVLWFRISRTQSDPKASLARVAGGRIMIMIERTNYWQCGYVAQKGAFDEIKDAGLAWFQNDVCRTAPLLSSRIGEIDSWDKVKLLSVTVDHLTRWYTNGCVCIGDAAHAMSPVGGVGINLAIQDAVAAANVLVGAFARGAPSEKDLARIQKRREFPARVTQGVQVYIQNKIIRSVLASTEPVALAWPLRLLRAFPVIRRIPARVIGLGVRREHIWTTEAV